MSNVRAHQMQPSALLVDFDGVIRRWPKDDEDVELECGLPLGSIREVAFSEPLLSPAIHGATPDALWRERIVEALESKYPEARVCEAVARWSGRAGVIDREVLQVLEQCKSRLKVILATNATSRLRSDLEAYGLARWFDAIANSSELMAVKPSAQFYEAALSIAQTEPSHALFIDDSASNVSSARALGIRAHLFSGLSGMVEFLRSVGVLNRDEL